MVASGVLSSCGHALRDAAEADQALGQQQALIGQGRVGAIDVQVHQLHARRVVASGKVSIS